MKAEKKRKTKRKAEEENNSEHGGSDTCKAKKAKKMALTGDTSENEKRNTKKKKKKKKKEIEGHNDEDDDGAHKVKKAAKNDLEKAKPHRPRTRSMDTVDQNEEDGKLNASGVSDDDDMQKGMGVVVWYLSLKSLGQQLVPLSIH